MNNHAMYMRVTMTTTGNLATSRVVVSVVCVRWGVGVVVAHFNGYSSFKVPFRKGTCRTMHFTPGLDIMKLFHAQLN